jgi:hypothetical protein
LVEGNTEIKAYGKMEESDSEQGLMDRIVRTETERRAVDLEKQLLEMVLQLLENKDEAIELQRLLDLKDLNGITNFLNERDIRITVSFSGSRPKQYTVYQGTEEKGRIIENWSLT